MHRKCYKGKITSQTRRIVYDKNTKTYEYKDNHVICGIPRLLPYKITVPTPVPESPNVAFPAIVKLLLAVMLI